MTRHFSQQFSEKGFTLLGWGDLGYAYLFSKEPVRTQTDLQKTALWVMDSDIVARAFVTASGKEPILLPVQSVLPSLTKNSVQTVYGPPLACIAFQWHTEVKYMTDLGLVPGVGATIMNKSRFEQLSSNHRRLLQEVTEKYHEQLVVKIRQRNQEAIEVLKGQGIEIIQVPYRERTKWKQIAGRVRNDFVGELYDKAFLDEVEGLLEEYRANIR
jgi:TRAP-type C4-dicarboxylate transport system substrate-binding protein